jgi:hypothetical protein
LISRRTSAFRKTFDQLPPRIQEQAQATFTLFSQDPQHPSLEFKQVHPSQPIFSARVSRDYRALAYRRENRWVWFWIGPHSAYDKMLTRL